MKTSSDFIVTRNTHKGNIGLNKYTVSKIFTVRVLSNSHQM